MKGSIIYLMLGCVMLLGTGCAAGTATSNISDVSAPKSATQENKSGPPESVKKAVIVEGKTEQTAAPAVAQSQQGEQKPMGRVKKMEGMKLTLELAQRKEKSEAENNKTEEKPQAKPEGKPGDKPEGKTPKEGKAPDGEPKDKGENKPPEKEKTEESSEGTEKAGFSLADLIFSGETKDYLLSSSTVIDGAEVLKADMVVILDLNDDGSVKNAKVIQLNAEE